MRILNLWNKPHITAQTSIPEADGFGDAFLLSLSLFGFLCGTFVSFTDVLINRFKTLLIKRISKLHEDKHKGINNRRNERADKELSLIHI